MSNVRELEAEKIRLHDALRESSDRNREMLQERVTLRHNLATIDAQLRSSQLSSRQIDVLEGIAAGETNYEIGQRLYITEETVKSHVKKILAKIQARNRSHAVLIAARMGLIE